jgi:outer membrane protein assembly factor BamB
MRTNKHISLPYIFSAHRRLVPLAVLLVSVMLLVFGAQPTYANHLPYTIGEVFAGVGDGKISRYTPTGVLIEQLDTTSGSAEETGMCFDGNTPTANLRSTNFTANNMTRFNNMGGVQTHPWAGPFNADPESCVVDGNGDIYVGQADGTGDILKFDADGNQLASFDVDTESRGSDWIDLAADQCTMFYTSEGKFVKRFDVCTNTQLPDFNATPLPTSPCFALRIRTNGEVLVACTDAAHRLSSAGTLMQSYPKSLLVPPGGGLGGEPSFLFALNLDPDKLSFWTAGYETGNIYRINIETGAQLTTFNAPPEVFSMAGLAIFGEPTVGMPGEPVSTPGKVNLGGYIDSEGNLVDPSELVLKNGPSAGGKATFGGSVRFQSGDPNPTGNVRYIDHVTGDNIKATSFSSLVISDGACGPNTHAMIKGKATVNGVPDQDLQIDVDDCAEPGSQQPGTSSSGPDMLMIMTGPGQPYMNGGPLVGGNIQVRAE